MAKAPKPSSFSVFRLIVRDRMNDWHFEQLDRVLGPIADGVRACGKFIDKASASGNEDYAQAVADDEVEVIEGLLGAAFVVCQTQIERVTHAVELLHRHASKVQPPKGPVKLTTTGKNKGDVLTFGSAMIGASGVTEAQALNAVANYFKHRESWPYDWSKFIAGVGAQGKKADNRDKQTAATMKTLQALGLQHGSTGNLRTAAEALGNADYADVDRFTDALRTWQTNVFKAYETELAAAGLM
jgi:hypothetical protein